MKKLGPSNFSSIEFLKKLANAKMQLGSNNMQKRFIKFTGSSVLIFTT